MKTYKILKPIKPLNRVLPVGATIELDEKQADKFKDSLEVMNIVEIANIKLPKKIENATSKKAANSEKKDTKEADKTQE